MAGLDGKITIERELRPCIEKGYEGIRYIYTDKKGTEREQILSNKTDSKKCLFHLWHPITGNAIVEYSDGTIHEVEPTQIRFVDNAMREYTFPEMEGT